ncbi:hypothetical protein X801_04329, partial [Opisthorchis viverrini]
PGIYSSLGICVVNLSAAIITSPNHPQPYPNELNWVFKFLVPKGCPHRLNLQEFRMDMTTSISQRGEDLWASGLAVKALHHFNPLKRSSP